MHNFFHQRVHVYTCNMYFLAIPGCYIFVIDDFFTGDSFLFVVLLLHDVAYMYDYVVSHMNCILNFFL